MKPLLTYSITLIIVLLITSCGESVPDKVEWADEEKTIKLWERKTENGVTAVTYYYSDGTKKRLDHFKGMKRDGKMTKWYNNGKLEYEKEYSNGLKSGAHKSYYSNGQISSERFFKEGKREQTWNYYLINGEKWLIESYQENSLASVDRLLNTTL